MSAHEKYWDGALTLSPGEQLAALQAKQYESETTERLMVKFDERILAMTAGIADATELQAASQKAEALLAEKQAIARLPVELERSHPPPFATPPELGSVPDPAPCRGQHTGR